MDLIRCGTVPVHRPYSRCQSVIGHTHVLVEGCIVGIQLIGHIGRLAPVIVKVIIDAHFPCFALLGYYHYDTVGSTCSVNGGRSGVLQDCDLIDVFSIQIAESRSSEITSSIT